MSISCGFRVSLSSVSTGPSTHRPWWSVDVPDQPAIVRQYMRYTGQIHSGKNAAKVMMRALQMWAPHHFDGVRVL